MKKYSKDKVIELLKNKKNKTFSELANETGYHEKSLIRINSLLKKNNYVPVKKKRKPGRSTDISLRNNIVNDYINGKYKSYKEIYNIYKDRVSYSYICKLLNNISIKKEILVIAKVKYSDGYYYKAIDYRSLKLLLCTKVSNNTINSILLNIFNNYGIPSNIYFYNIKNLDNKLIKKYKINVFTDLKIISKRIYHLLKKEYDCNVVNHNLKYRKYNYSKEDFYKCVKRKVLRNNLIQFNNIRYKILCDKNIKHLECVNLYFNNDDVFIKYNNKVYNIVKYEVVISKKGNSKYI